MNKISTLRYLLGRNLIMMVGVFLCIYFSYHAVQGQRSFSRLMSVETTTWHLQNEHALLVKEREALEQKVVMLRPGSINRDLLEERVRYVLGYRHPDEVAVVSSVSY